MKEIGKKIPMRNFLAACAVAASLSCCVVFAEEEFSPLNNNFASTNIYLDSSQVEHPVLQGFFPSPSEYSKFKHSAQTSVFSPVDEQKQEMSATYKVDDKENPTEIKAVGNEPEVKDFGLSDMDFFAPPSQYKKSEKTANTPPPQKQTEITANSPPEELPSVDAPDENYYASAETTESEDLREFEGKTISGITVKGLSHLNEDNVLYEISSVNGSIFNAEKLQQDLQKIYSTGYFTDVMHVEPIANSDDTVSLEFYVQENPVVKDVEITGNTIFTENELQMFTKSMVGLPQNIYSINSSIEKIQKQYEDEGYILARVTSVDDSPDGILKLGISEGKIDKIIFEGNIRTKDFIIERNIMTKPGTIYNEEMLKKDLSKIYATQIFEEANRKIEPSPDYEGEYIVTIVVKEASSNSISIGGGVDSGLGVFGALRVMDKNFLGRGQQLSLSGMIGSGIIFNDASMKEHMNYQVELNFVEPYFLNADNSLASKVYLRELGSYQIPLAIERRFGASTVLKHKVKNNDNITTNLGLGFENIHLREGDYNRIAQQYALSGINFANREKQLRGGDFINITPGIQYTNVDKEFMPRDGITASASFMESLAVDDMRNTSGRFVGKITKYIPVFEKSTLMFTTKGGIKVHGDRMPEVMAFTLGGPYSIRGFRMSGVGSGNSYLMGSVELQTPLPFMDKFKYEVLKNLRFAFFVDAGKIWDPTITSRLYDRPCSAITAGVGLRVNIPGLGPISVDYGLPLTNTGHYSKQHGYVTFGSGSFYDGY